MEVELVDHSQGLLMLGVCLHCVKTDGDIFGYVGISAHHVLPRMILVLYDDLSLWLESTS